MQLWALSEVKAVPAAKGVGAGGVSVLDGSAMDRIEPMTDARDLALPSGYADLLGQLKERVRAARTQALRTVNTQLIELYWSIGKTILERQESRVGERGHWQAGR